jgi:site-specific recombinase XerD
MSSKIKPQRPRLLHPVPTRTMQSNVHKQTYLLPSDWEHAIDEWLDWLRAAAVPKTTLRTRRGHIRRVARILCVATPAEVTTDHLVAVFARLDWSAEHRRGVRTTLIKFYTWAVARGMVDENPAADLPRVPESRPRPRPAPDRIWQQILIHAGPRERLMAQLAGEGGLRRAEVARVHTNDLLEDMDGWALVVHGKGGKQRMVPVSDALAREIAKGPGGHTIGRGRSGWLFPGQDDGHLSPDTVGKLISELMPEGWSMHKLRHRFATRAFQGTRNLLAVQEALGHASVATTQRYTAITRDDVRAAVQAAA